MPIETVSFKGKTILIVDLSNRTSAEGVQILQQAQQRIALMPPKSALLLTDVTNTPFDSAGAKAVKACASSNTPFVKASAVVGADGFRAVVLETVRMLTRRDIKPCKSRVEAMAWLASRD
jgi:hypothetical protein